MSTRAACGSRGMPNSASVIQLLPVNSWRTPVTYTFPLKRSEKRDNSSSLPGATPDRPRNRTRPRVAAMRARSSALSAQLCSASLAMLPPCQRRSSVRVEAVLSSPAVRLPLPAQPGSAAVASTSA